MKEYYRDVLETLNNDDIFWRTEILENSRRFSCETKTFAELIPSKEERNSWSPERIDEENRWKLVWKETATDNLTLDFDFISKYTGADKMATTLSRDYSNMRDIFYARLFDSEFPWNN